MKLSELIGILKKFSTSMIEMYDPIEPVILKHFEERYKLILPTELEELLLLHNGINLMGTEIYGITSFSNRYDLKKCYEFEHEVGNKMPLFYLPFSPDGYGNHYCFDLSSKSSKEKPIIFWQHDCLYSLKEEPEVVNNNLNDWIKEVMIDWTLDDYNYDGTEK